MGAALINKNELAKAFDVSITTVDKWLTRGCPYVEKGTNGREYKFSLNEVIRWRELRNGNSSNRLSMGRDDALISAFEVRPDHANFFRYLIEDAVKSYIRFTIDSAVKNGILQKLAMISESKEAAFLLFQNTMLCGVVEYARHWVLEDVFNRTLKRSTKTDIDMLSRDLLNNPVVTQPPKTIDDINQFDLPDWMMLSPNEFVQKYWQDESPVIHQNGNA